MTQYVLALPGGAELLDAQHTRFRVWAPSQHAVSVQLGDGRVLPMQARDGGWFEQVVACGAGSRYRYVLDDGQRVPDPYSRGQHDDVHGDSVVVDPHAYHWRNPQWRGRSWTQTVLYEVHVGCCGGFEGLRRRLPGLQALGITAVELMPVADFPGARNWGYDGVLPFAPDRAYGTPEQLKALVDDAHALGLMVFMDVVYNHFGPDGNYLHRYAPDFFRQDQPTLWGPALDFSRPEVRAYFTTNALYWLQEYQFDGLRFDAVQAIPDTGWLQETAAAIRGALEPARHVHLVLENDDNDAELLHRCTQTGFDAQWNDDLHHALHVLLTGESDGYYAGFSQAPAQQLARCLSEGFAYQGEHSPVHGRLRGKPSAGLPPHAFVMFLQNHDQTGNRAFGERLTTLADPEALRAATALQLLCPQIPMLFMGEEWGCRKPFLFFTHHGAELARLVRDGRRREFAHFARFAADADSLSPRPGGEGQGEGLLAHRTARSDSPSPQPSPLDEGRGRPQQIPDPNDPQTFADACPDFDAAQTGEGAARWREYAALLKLRQEQLVPGLPGARSLGAEVLSSHAVLARWRLGDGRRLTLACNLGSEPVRCSVPPQAVLIHATAGDARQLADGCLPARCTLAFMELAFIEEGMPS